MPVCMHVETECASVCVTMATKFDQTTTIVFPFGHLHIEHIHLLNNLLYFFIVLLSHRVFSFFFIQSYTLNLSLRSCIVCWNNFSFKCCLCCCCCFCCHCCWRESIQWLLFDYDLKTHYFCSLFNYLLLLLHRKLKKKVPSFTFCWWIYDS